MASEWKYVRFGDVVNCISKKINVKNADIRHYVSTDNMVGNFGGIVDAQSFPKNGSVTQFVVGDVLFSNIRTYFKKVWQAEFDGFCSNDVLVFRPLSSSNLSANYLFQICRWNRFTQYSIRTAKGVKMPRGDKAALVEFSFKLPNISEQERISEIFNIIDKKIQLNKQMNETLEQMAQALFQSWFVDFDPVIDNALNAGNEIPEALQTQAEKRRAVRSAADFKPLPADIRALFPNEFEQSAELSVGIDGWIPKGWKLLPLDKIADFRNGLALQKFRPEKDSDDFLPVLKIAQLNQGYTDGKEKARTDIKKEYIVNDGDMIFSWSGTLMIDLWTGGKAALNQHLFKVYSEIFPLSIYLHWTKHYLLKFQQIAAGKAVTMGHIKKGDLSSAICLLPSDNLIKKFDEFVSPWIKKYIDTRIENNSLTKLRDTLLPKLISGELRLDQLDAVEEPSQQ